MMDKHYYEITKDDFENWWYSRVTEAAKTRINEYQQQIIQSSLSAVAAHSDPVQSLKEANWRAGFVAGLQFFLDFQYQEPDHENS